MQDEWTDLPAGCGADYNLDPKKKVGLCQDQCTAVTPARGSGGDTVLSLSMLYRRPRMRCAGAQSQRGCRYRSAEGRGSAGA